MIDKRKKKLTIITGATSGIGLALTKQLLPSHNLIVIGRKNKQDLPQEIFDKIIYIQTDISNMDETISQIISSLNKREVDKVDHLVHCAGTGVYKTPDDELQTEIENSVSVNLRFPIALTHALYDRLNKSSGKVTFIGSVARKGSPNMASYAAAKAGLHGFARALAVEWEGKVSVQILHPGPTLTPMLEKAGYKLGVEKILFLKPEVMAKEIVGFMRTDKFTKTVFLGAKLKHAILGVRP